MAQTIESPYVDSKQAANFLCTTSRVLANWRCLRKYNLPYIKRGSKVLYRRADLEKFLEDRVVNLGAPVSNAPVTGKAVAEVV